MLQRRPVQLAFGRAMTVPAGGAVAVGVSYAMYSSWGFGASQVALSALYGSKQRVFFFSPTP